MLESAVEDARNGQNKARRQPIVLAEFLERGFLTLPREVRADACVADDRIAYVDTRVLREVIESRLRDCQPACRLPSVESLPCRRSAGEY
jgi:hypothetical protein